MNLKERIRGEMKISQKELDIKELVDMNIWNEEDIRKRWKELEDLK